MLVADSMLINRKTLRLLNTFREDQRLDRLPIIILGSQYGRDDKLQALKSGADDYITRPFSHRELVARIRAALRRTSRMESALPAQNQAFI